jgi:hypothetical protein
MNQGPELASQHFIIELYFYFLFYFEIILLTRQALKWADYQFLKISLSPLCISPPPTTGSLEKTFPELFPHLTVYFINVIWDS